MSKQILKEIGEQAPELLERMSESEILNQVFDTFTKSEQIKMVSLFLADYKGERYDLL